MYIYIFEFYQVITRKVLKGTFFNTLLYSNTSEILILYSTQVTFFTSILYSTRVVKFQYFTQHCLIWCHSAHFGTSLTPLSRHKWWHNGQGHVWTVQIWQWQLTAQAFVPRHDAISTTIRHSLVRWQGALGIDDRRKLGHQPVFPDL